jgi:outer membrane protein TolC
MSRTSARGRRTTTRAPQRALQYPADLQVLDAERLYEQARLGFVRALVQRYIDTVQLFLALGGTSPSEKSETSPSA